MHCNKSRLTGPWARRRARRPTGRPAPIPTQTPARTDSQASPAPLSLSNSGPADSNTGSRCCRTGSAGLPVGLSGAPTRLAAYPSLGKLPITPRIVPIVPVVPIIPVGPVGPAIITPRTVAPTSPPVSPGELVLAFFSLFRAAIRPSHSGDSLADGSQSFRNPVLVRGQAL